MKATKQGQDLPVPAAMAAMVSPGSDHQVGRPGAIPDESIIERSHRGSAPDKDGWMPGAQGEKIDNIEASEAPVASEPSATLDCRVIELLIGSVGIEHDEQDPPTACL